MTVWVVSKNESNCLLENKMVSTLIWRNVILLYVVKSNILWLTFKLSYHYRCNILCTVSFLLYIATKKQNHYCKQFYECPYLKKITLARFACLCLIKVICLWIPAVQTELFLGLLRTQCRSKDIISGGGGGHASAVGRAARGVWGHAPPEHFEI